MVERSPGERQGAAAGVKLVAEQQAPPYPTQNVAAAPVLDPSRALPFKLIKFCTSSFTSVPPLRFYRVPLLPSQRL